ncbi:hypothetical protein MAM1_0419d10421 [Mucor ambiguus]|uniref:C3H1-type domain-containing protein n=1 Tax=Mucor ambiguus TaxID=91626 RepID=A0A0C9MJ46_9FUNG|nr:hypothetical protein MAM1_0419d10421 [Mucor ambiguus]
MSNLLEKIVLLATRATLGTIACILVGTVCVYIVLFGNKKAPSTIQQHGSREIQKDDAHSQIKSSSPVDDEKHTDSIKAEKKDNETVKTDRESDASVQVVKPQPFLAQYEATVAIVLRDAANYKPTLVKSISTETKEEEEGTTGHVESSREVKTKSAVAVVASAAVATTASAIANTLGTDQDVTLVESKAPEPVLAAYEATTASTALQAQQFIASLPKVPRAPEPFLAAFEATTASTALEASKYISTLPKAPKPFLAAFEATTASVSLAASQYIAALPKAPRPFLAAFEATCAITALEAQQFVAAMPKPPKPFIAAYQATTALVEMEASQNIKELVASPEYTEALAESHARIAKHCEPSNPVLAAYEATAAECAVVAQKHVAAFVAAEDYQRTLEACREKLMAQFNKSASSDNLSQYDITTASTISASREYIDKLTSNDEYLDAMKTATAKLHQVINKEVPPAITTSLASLEATAAYQLLQHQNQQQQQHVESDSDIEVEIEDNVLSSPSAVSSVSSTTSTELARGISNHKKPSEISTEDAKAQFDVSWDQMYANSNNNKKPAVADSPKSTAPFMSTIECTYYPNCTNKNCKFVHPGKENNPKPKRAATMDAVYKKPWTKAERIERQSQTHFPTWKSRCVHWPYCTNNHCKYSHPIKECRMGEQCTFMDRCMFLHPSDFLEPVKKRYTPKRSQTLPQMQSQEPESLPPV